MGWVTWILGAAMTVLSLVGFLVASRAVRGTFYYVGLGLFALGLVAVFTLIPGDRARRRGAPSRPSRI